jgi:hypothetical protein
LNALIPTLTLAQLTNLDPVLQGLKQRVAARVKSAIRNAQSTIEKITHPDQDDTIGTDVKVIFAQNDQIGTDPSSLSTASIAIATPFHNEGSWTLSGIVTVAPSRHVFLRIVGRGGLHLPDVIGSGPLPGVSVRLFELDNPAPAGDDVAIPQTGETDQIVHGQEIINTTTYDPAPDQLLGVQTTDQSGVAAFQVFPNRRGGVLTHTRIVEDLHTSTTTSTTTHTPIAEARPDYGVTVVGHGGKILAQRQLVALNAPGNVGTATNPLDVLVDRDDLVVVAQQ